MNAYHARVTCVYTAPEGGTVEDDAPNLPDSGRHEPGFDVIVNAAAGAAIGDCGAPYTLTITLVNLTKQASVGTPFSFVKQQKFDAATGWTSSRDDFVLTYRAHFPDAPPPPNAAHDLYRFYVSMVTPGLRVVSFAGSRLFILV